MVDSKLTRDSIWIWVRIWLIPGQISVWYSPYHLSPVRTTFRLWSSFFLFLPFSFKLAARGAVRLWTTLVTPLGTALVRINAFQRTHAWGRKGYVYTKTVDTVEGALWLATHTPNILCYQPSNGIYERKYLNRCRNKRVKIIFCVLYYLTVLEYTTTPLFSQCRRLFVDIKCQPPTPSNLVNSC